MISGYGSGPAHTTANVVISPGVSTAPRNTKSKTCFVVAQPTRTSAGMYFRIFSTQLSGRAFMDTSGTLATSCDTLFEGTAPVCAVDAWKSVEIWWLMSSLVWSSFSTASDILDASCSAMRLLRMVRGILCDCLTTIRCKPAPTTCSQSDRNTACCHHTGWVQKSTRAHF